MLTRFSLLELSRTVHGSVFFTIIVGGVAICGIDDYF